jgi:zinc protease
MKITLRNCISTPTLLLFALIPVSSLAQHTQRAMATSSTALPLDPAVRTGKLANGFTYYIRHNEEPKNRVVFYLANKVGSILEKDDQQGLAHFMEHMSFNGTSHYPKNELIDYLQKAGVRFGADINAYTGFNETVYQLPLPSDDPKLVANGLQIMRDWAHGASLDVSEINKERGVVLEEKRLGKGAKDRMQKLYWPVVLNHSRYAYRMPIGTDSVLNTFKSETLRSFYNDWYRPDLQALIIVGDIDVAQIEQAVKAKFSVLENPVNEKKRIQYDIQLTGQNNFVSVTDKEMTSTVMDILFKQPGKKLSTADDYRAALVSSLLNNMLVARYTEVSRRASPPFLQGSAGIQALLGGLDNYDITVVAKPGELEKGFKAVWRETVIARQFGFTQTELDRVKHAQLNKLESAFKEKDKTPSASYVNEYLAHFLHQTAAPGIEGELALNKTYLQGISLDEVNKLLKTSITALNRDIVVMAPERDKATLPENAKILEWMASVEKETLSAHVDLPSSGNLLISQPVGGKIVKQSTDPHNGLTQLTLSNGIRVILKPSTFKNNEILFNGFSAGGSSLYSDTDYQSASESPAIISSFGIGNKDLNELDKYLSDKQVRVRPYITERYQGIRGMTVNDDLETALALTYAFFTEPRKDSLIFKGMIGNIKGAIANRKNDPNAVFQDTVNAVLGMNSIRRTGPTLDKIQRINLNRVLEIYRERFGDASGFTFIFTGSFDNTVIKPLIEKYLGSLPVLNRAELPRDLKIQIPPGIIQKTVYKGSEQKSTVNLVFSGPFNYSLQNKLTLEALKECLQIRLLERLREEESGVYSPSARISFSKLPENKFSLSVVFGCAPQNVEKLISSTLDEINKLKTEGPAQINLDKFKAENKRNLELQFKSNGFWMGYLVGQLQTNENLDQIDEYSTQLDKITSGEVKNIAQAYLSGKNYIRLVLLPENIREAK